MSDIIWLYGRSGAGKTTTAKLLEKYLGGVLLDGDEARLGLNSDLGFSDDDRMENNRRIAETANLLHRQSHNVIIATILPTHEIRQRAKELCPQAVFVYVHTSDSVCRRRDTKGLYAKGEDMSFSKPAQYDLQVHGTDVLTENVQEIIHVLGVRNSTFIKGDGPGAEDVPKGLSESVLPVEPVYPPGCDNLQFLREVLDNDEKVLLAKGGTYGDSWKKRGGCGAFMMLARKWDRIENIGKREGYNIFAILGDEGPNAVDGLLDDIGDLRRYLALVESELRYRFSGSNPANS